jgi:hypothetical protein
VNNKYSLYDSAIFYHPLERKSCTAEKGWGNGEVWFESMPSHGDSVNLRNHYEMFCGLNIATAGTHGRT